MMHNGRKTFYWHTQRRALELYFADEMRLTTAWVEINKYFQPASVAITDRFVYVTPTFNDAAVPDGLVNVFRDCGAVIIHVDETHARAAFAAKNPTPGILT